MSCLLIEKPFSATAVTEPDNEIGSAAMVTETMEREMKIRLRNEPARLAKDISRDAERLRKW